MVGTALWKPPPAIVGTAPGAVAPDGDRQAADGPDTEQLRLLIQRYRRLFDQLSR